MNNNQFNSEQFNQDHAYALWAEYLMSFNGYDLMSHCGETSWTIVQSGNFHNVVAQLTSSESSMSDGWSVIDKRYSNKTIVITVYIQGTSHNDLIAKIDKLKEKIQWVEWDFDILVWEKIRRYTATVQSVVIPPFKKSMDFVEWIEIEMLITSPHWRFKDLSQVYAQSMTADFSKVVLNEWNYKTYPIVEVITNAWSTLSAISVDMKRVWEVSWYTISIAETINPGSVVIFDYIEKKVTINDVEVNFSGIMMPLEIGQSVFTFDFTWSINVNAYVLHYPTFQ